LLANLSQNFHIKLVTLGNVFYIAEQEALESLNSGTIISMFYLRGSLENNLKYEVQLAVKI
jgi:hypothetical protein